MRQVGVTWIKGKEYLLAGRYDSREEAENSAAGLMGMWDLVKVRSTPKARMGNWSVWVHGRKLESYVIR